MATKTLLMAAGFLTACLWAQDEPELKENDALKQLVPADKKDAKDAKDDEPKPDKSIYNLFHPTPKDLMREMTSDRPDQTEGTHTVDAGHFQIETGLFEFSYDKRNPERVNRRVKEFSVIDTNYKVGLFNDVDFQVVVPSYTVRRTTEKGHTEILQGFGDITLRSKINLKNNDDEGPSVAVLPFLKLPTNQGGLGNKAVEGGGILPWSVDLPKGWTTAGDFEIDVNRNDTDHAYHAEYGGTYEFSHKVISKLSGYLEFSALASTERHSHWVGTFDTGVVWELNKNMRLDTGVNIGVTRSAEDVRTFAGFSVRF